MWQCTSRYIKIRTREKCGSWSQSLLKKYSIIEVMIVDYNFFSVKITIRIIIRIPRIYLELYPKADFKAELVSVIFIFRSIVVKCLRGSVILPRSRTWASGPTEPPGRSRPPATRWGWQSVNQPIQTVVTIDKEHRYLERKSGSRSVFVEN